MASTATPTATQTAALTWVQTREGKRPSSTALRLLVDRGWTTAATNEAELTEAGRVALGLSTGEVTTDPAELAVLTDAAADLDALPTDDDTRTNEQVEADAAQAEHDQVEHDNEAEAALRAEESTSLDAAPAPGEDTTAPEVPAVPSAEDQRAAEVNAQVDAVELTPFNGADGQPIRIGGRVEVAAKGNNVRVKDIGQQGTVTGWNRNRVRVTWDATEDAPWKAILPALVNVLS